MEATQHDFFQLEFFGQLRSRTIYFGETFLREAWKWEIPDCFKRPDSQISDAQSEDIRKYVATLIYNKTSKKTTFDIFYEGLHPILIVFLLDFFTFFGLRFWDAHSCNTLKKTQLPWHG